MNFQALIIIIVGVSLPVLQNSLSDDIKTIPGHKHGGFIREK